MGPTRTHIFHRDRPCLEEQPGPPAGRPASGAAAREPPSFCGALVRWDQGLALLCVRGHNAQGI